MKIPQKKPMNILFICSGNIMRSPLAEMLFEKLITEKHGDKWRESLNIDSGAVRFKNKRIHSLTKNILLLKGISEERIQRFSPRHIQNHPQLFENADLILTMSNGQKKRLITKYNTSFADKTHLLPEFVGKEVSIPDPWFKLRRKKTMDEVTKIIEECLVLLLEKFEPNGLLN